MNITEIKSLTNAVRVGFEKLNSTKLIKVGTEFDTTGKMVSYEERPMNEVFPLIMTFLNSGGKSVGACLLNKSRADIVRDNKSAILNAEYEVAIEQWGEEKIPLFKIKGHLFSDSLDL